jgi:uncharacterized membrane protein YgcG
MKYLLSLILFISHLNLNAGSITDNANILGPRLEEFSVKIAPLPIFIESHETLSDPRAYADTKVKELTSRGFLIVVTTNPRKWRISMTPERVVSGEQTRLIGDKMMPHFKQGDYYSGLLLAANDLNKLLSQDVAVEQVTSAKAPSKHESLAASILVGVFLLIGMIIISYLIYKRVNKPVMRVTEIKEKPLYGQAEPKKELTKSSDRPTFVTGEYFAPKAVSGQVVTPNKKHSEKQYYCPPLRNNYSSPDSGPDLITPLIVYSAFSSSDDDSRKKSSSSSSSDSYSSDSSSSYDSSSSSSDSGGSSGGDW